MNSDTLPDHVFDSVEATGEEPDNASDVPEMWFNAHADDIDGIDVRAIARDDVDFESPGADGRRQKALDQSLFNNLKEIKMGRCCRKLDVWAHPPTQSHSCEVWESWLDELFLLCECNRIWCCRMACQSCWHDRLVSRFPSNREIHHMFDIEHVFMVPTTVVSPLHAALLPSVKGDQRCIIALHTAPQPLLMYHTDTGFAGVPEAILIHLVGNRKMPMPEPMAKVGQDAVLAAAPIDDIRTDMAPDDEEKAMRERALHAKLETDFIDILELEALNMCWMSLGAVTGSA